MATAGSAVPWAEGVLSLAWSEVDAVIVFSRDKPGHGIIGVGVKYRYTVAGREYTGDRYRFHSILERGHMRGRDVQMALGWYPAGERVELAVNPRDPADSVLEPGPDLANLEPFGAGLCFYCSRLATFRKARAAQNRRLGNPFLPVQATEPPRFSP